MLNNLCGPASKGFSACLEFCSLPLNFDSLVPFARTWTAEKRKTTFLGIIRPLLFDDFGIEHHGVYRSSSALIKEIDDALSHTDHICRHTDAGFLVRHQCVEQVLCDR